MSNLKRIDPKAIPALFEKHGMTPIRHLFFARIDDGRKCSCVNTVLVAEAIGDEQAIKHVRGHDTYWHVSDLAPLSGYQPDYALGLAVGWDGGIVCRGQSTDAELLGMQDGLAAWEACQTPSQSDRLAAQGRHPSNSPFAMQKS